MKTIKQSRGSSGCFQDKSAIAPKDQLLTDAATHEKQRGAWTEHDENGLQLVCTNEFLPWDWRHLSS